MLRALEVSRVHRFWIGEPEPVISGDVINLVASSDRALDRIEVSEIAEDDFDVEAGECAHVGVLAYQGANLVAARKQSAHHVAAYDSICAGDER
jgi:hypothetical protein